MNSESTCSSTFDFAHDQGRVSTQGFPSQVKCILHLLRKLEHGILVMEFPDGQSATYGTIDDERARPVTMRLKSWDVFHAVLRSGDIGFAEAFIDDHWRTDNLPGPIQLFIRNRQAIESIIYGRWWGNLLYRVKHLCNRNSKTGSRKNIHAHYDIGNDFYQLWLDPSMSYSSALFSAAHVENLQQVQDAKYRRILNQLHIADNARVLEIGCGWGGFAEIAVRRAKAHVTGLTLSTEQLRFAHRHLQQAGIVDQVELLLQDFSPTVSTWHRSRCKRFESLRNYATSTHQRDALQHMNAP